ncbi:tetratricopeptide repeat protein [Saccharothrix longispora]|uniref:tetratricopeptide repeat protein n=1 Tax=Saccharothrix longispora TaxID=33920 RepID=UPI0028FD13C9|nr:tetratricopeptide repeat protein [Saccharothrix longispora]MBY8849993.1 tetratricopeptide repeat protein [Saccharothrix sp. MB29]MDU0291221.1 tetratricopeptide repeat protein [Saccharothrix longispora]
MSEPIAAAVVRAAELTARGLPRQAIGVLRPALAANPRHAEAWCRLAAAHLDAGEPDPALDAAKRALVLHGDHAWAQRLTALALSELDRHAEATVAARECVRREPDDWRCHVVLAEVLAADPHGRAEAVDAARRAAHLAPDEARPHQVLGDAALRVRDWGTAERAYRTALRLDPHDDDVRANLATVRRKRGGKPVEAPGDALNSAHALVWPALSRLAVLLVAGGLLLLLAGMPRPTPLLAWFATALLLGVLAVVGRLLLRARRGVRRALFRLPRHRPRVAVVVVLFGLAALVLAGWAVALFLGATTVQPLVVAWLCSLLGGAVVVLGGPR